MSEETKQEIKHETVKIIETILVEIDAAREDVFNRMEYFSRKYQKYSDITRDVNVSISYNVEKKKPQVVIYCADKFSRTRITLLYSLDGKDIVEKIVEIKEKMKDAEFITVNTPLYSEDFSNLTNRELRMHIADAAIKELGDVEILEVMEVGGYPTNNNRVFKVYYE